MTMHSFICRVSLHDKLFLEVEQDDDIVNIFDETNNGNDNHKSPRAPSNHSEVFSSESQAFMVNLRDKIADLF